MLIFPIPPFEHTIGVDTISLLAFHLMVDEDIMVALSGGSQEENGGGIRGGAIVISRGDVPMVYVTDFPKMGTVWSYS